MERITRTAEGNPLYVEQTLSMLVEDGTLLWEDGVCHLTADPETIDIPPTISALIAARLDQLGQLERDVVERGAVIGQTFWAGAVAALMPADLEPAIAPSLRALTAKELVAPDGSNFEGQDAYSFRHILIRDSTYGGLLKRDTSRAARAVRRLVGLVHRRPGDRVRGDHRLSPRAVVPESARPRSPGRRRPHRRR